MSIDCCAVTRNRLLERYDLELVLCVRRWLGNSSMRMPMITAHSFQ